MIRALCCIGDNTSGAALSINAMGNTGKDIFFDKTDGADRNAI